MNKTFGSRPGKILVIFPEAAPMWRRAEQRLSDALGDRVGFAHDLNDGADATAMAEIIVTFALKPSAAARAHKLQWVQALGAGVDGISLPPGRDVLLTNAAGLHGAAVSEAALAFMLWHSRKLPALMADRAERLWSPYASSRLAGSTLGILGTGAIGRALSRRAEALEMKVIGFSRTPRPLEGFFEVAHRQDLLRLAPTLDYLVLVAPVETAAPTVIDRAVLRALKPDALLVNVGRGGLVDEEALAEALTEGRFSAALDAFAVEPLAPDSPFWTTPNTLVSPHSAGRHTLYVDEVLDLFLENLMHFEAGQPNSMRNLSVLAQL